MKKNFLIIIIPLIAIGSVFSQKKLKTTKTTEHYVSIKYFKKIFKREVTKSDLQHIKIVGKDTLILVNDSSIKIDKYQSSFKNKSKATRIGKTELRRTYISLSRYKKKYKRRITPEDLANFIIRDGDTLIQIDNKDFYKKGVSVPYEPKDSTFLEAYKDIVYQKYRSKKQKKEIRQRYWKDELKIYITKNLDKKVKRELKKFAKYLSKNVDSLKISFVNKLEKSNYIVYGINSDTDYNYEPKLKRKKVDYYMYWNSRQQIYRAKLQIDSRSYEKKEDLVLKTKKMFLNSLGMFNWTYKTPKEGYFSLKYYKKKEFNKLDLEILKYHYSFGICKGMTLNLFDQAHDNAKKVFIKTGRHTQFKHIN
jgi:hypothetical protein